MDEFILKSNHYMFSYLGLSFNKKYLFLLDEKNEEIKINVRVGQAVDTVGQVGK